MVWYYPGPVNLMKNSSRLFFAFVLGPFCRVGVCQLLAGIAVVVRYEKGKCDAFHRNAVAPS